MFWAAAVCVEIYLTQLGEEKGNGLGSDNMDSLFLPQIYLNRYCMSRFPVFP